jgi:ATP-dependent DNA helicase RecQ
MWCSLQSKKLVLLYQEVVAYAETSMSRRKFFYCIALVKSLTVKRADMDDNVRNKKSKKSSEPSIVSLKW